jgi:DNA-binding GntR family transcriptional regulator
VPVPHDRQRVIVRRLQKDEVHERLLDAIVSGELPAGSRLRDVDLEAWLGVSRTPVRAALVRLEQTGLVEGRPQRSRRVARLRPSIVPDLVVVLCALWRDRAQDERGLLVPEGAYESRRALGRCAEAVDALRSATSPGIEHSRAVVDTAFACVARLEGDDVPDATRELLDDLGARLRQQAALLGRRLDTAALTTCLAEVDAAVLARDARLLRSALDGLARRTARALPGPAEPRPAWWSR